MPAPLLNVATEHAQLKQDLVATFGGGDDEALCDTLEGLSSFKELVAATMRSSVEDEATAEALNNLINQMSTRLDRFKYRAKAKRELVEKAMIRAGEKRIELPDMTLSISARAPFVIVTESDKLPAEFWATPAPVVSKAKIAAALKAGQVVPGAVQSNGGAGLTVRVK